jgi:Na+-driven multidrug efflux pump
LGVIRLSADLDPEGSVLGIREITGYIAHLLLVGYWLWVVFSAAPQLRRGSRDRRVRMEVLLIKTAGFVLTGLVVGVIHFWATEWWHVVVAVLVAAGLGMLLTRAYRRRVALPKHRLTLTHRARTFERGRRLPDV